MALKNADIVKRIKAARLEAGLTQKDVAEHLGRTSAAISDLERGKVEVSAEELFKLARFFKKPVEYFYGDNFGGAATQEIVAALRSLASEDREALLSQIRNLMRMWEISKRLQALSEETEPDKQELEKLVIEYYGTMQLLSQQSAAVTAQSQAMAAQLAEALHLGGQEDQPEQQPR